MSATQLKWVAALLVVAALGWLISERLAERPDDREVGRLMPASVEGVDRVVFDTDAGTIVLARDGSEWTVNDLPVSQERLGTLFLALSDTAEYEVVAQSPAMHGRMGVDASGVQVRFFRGNDQVDYVIFGKRGSDPRAMFARRDGEDVVYRYLGSMTELVDLRLDDWRNKVVVNARPETIGRLEVDRPDDRFGLERRADGWVVLPDVPADSAAVGRWLRNFLPLQATGFAAPATLDSIDLDRPDRRVGLYGTAGDTIAALEIYGVGTRSSIRSHGNPTVFVLGPGQADRIAPERAGLLPVN